MSRSGYKWSMNEINTLYNQYELKGLSIDEIAKLHKRSSSGILFKLQECGFDVTNHMKGVKNNMKKTTTVKFDEYYGDSDDEDYDDVNDEDYTSEDEMNDEF
jgi:hypothetical protein